MPHLLYEQGVLDVKYPSLTAPAQLDVDDTEADAHDAIYQRGLREAAGIAESMRLLGRMKYMKPRDTQSKAVPLQGSMSEREKDTTSLVMTSDLGGMKGPETAISSPVPTSCPAVVRGKLGRVADLGVHNKTASEEFERVSRGCSIAVAPGPSR